MTEIKNRRDRYHKFTDYRIIYENTCIFTTKHFLCENFDTFLNMFEDCTNSTQETNNQYECENKKELENFAMFFGVKETLGTPKINDFNVMSDTVMSFLWFLIKFEYVGFKPEDVFKRDVKKCKSLDDIKEITEKCEEKHKQFFYELFLRETNIRLKPSDALEIKKDEKFSNAFEKVHDITIEQIIKNLEQIGKIFDVKKIDLGKS